MEALHARRRRVGKNFTRPKTGQAGSKQESDWWLATRGRGAAVHYSRLGKTELNVSTIALGTWAFGGDWGTFDDAV